MTLAFAQKIPRGRVVAFEPTHSGFARLKKNLAIQAFLSDRSADRHGLSACSSWKLMEAAPIPTPSTEGR